MRNSFDYTRFIHFARVIFVENQFQICVRDKVSLQSSYNHAQNYPLFFLKAGEVIPILLWFDFSLSHQINSMKINWKGKEEIKHI